MGETAAGPDMRPLTWLWLGGLCAAGLVAAGLGWSRMPPSRDALTAVETTGPVWVRLELVNERSGRYGNSTYRTQRISLGGHTVSPPRTLWVDGLDRLRTGQRVLFLIDAGQGIVFEATSEGRTLLSYEASAGNRRGGAWAAILLGLAFLAAGGFGLARRWLWMRANGY